MRIATPRLARKLILPISVTCILLSCAPRGDEHLAEDVDRYLERMQAWASVEVETDMAIRSILATQFVDDAAVLRILADSRPIVTRQIRTLEACRPGTPDVQAIHTAYLQGWRDLLNGYFLIEQGIEAADGRRIAQGRNALTNWRRSLRTIAIDLADLATLTDGRT